MNERLAHIVCVCGERFQVSRWCIIDARRRTERERPGRGRAEAVDAAEAEGMVGEAREDWDEAATMAAYRDHLRRCRRRRREE